jgi:selenocysteine-specific elongation factor
MRSLVIGTAGHIDHGKSTLVRALTGIDPDRLKEEQERGITIDLGFAHFQADDVTYAFVDVPGHERFVKNMLAGVGGIDCILLVVAADESVKPQTREHFDICRLLRVPDGAVVITKTDLVDAETVELVKLEVRDLATGTFLQDAPVVPVSAATGDGLQVLKQVLARLAHEADRAPRRVDAPVRLPIDRVFSIKGFGTVVTGTLTSGTIAEERELVVLPTGRPVKVRGVQVHGRRASSAHAGQRTAVNLAGVELADLQRGDTLADPGSLRPSRRVDAIVDLLASARPLKDGARIRLHHGTAEILGRVSLASSQRTLEPGRDAYARIHLETSAVVTRADRFILRAYSPTVTIGGGEVLDPDPPRGPIRTETGLERFARLDPRRQTIDDAALSFVVERLTGGISRQALGARLGVAPNEVDSLVKRLVELDRVVDVGPVVIARPIVEVLSARVVMELQAEHARDPISEGRPREEVRERLFSRAHPAVFDHVIGRLVSAGTLIARDRLSLASHKASLSDEEARARDAVEALFKNALFSPPDAGAIAATAGLAPPLVDRMLKLLLRQKTLVRVEGLVFHAEALARLKSDVAALKAGSQSARLDVAAFKERYGVSRKYAIPLLEYLDRERITKRVGDSRVLL